VAFDFLHIIRGWDLNIVGYVLCYIVARNHYFSVLREPKERILF